MNIPERGTKRTGAKQQVDRFALSVGIRRIAGGDLDALEEIFKEMKNSIYAFAYMYVGDRQTAEDILQETMLQIAESAKNFRVYGNPRAWIMAIARNIAANWLRKTGRETEFSENFADRSTPFEYRVTGELSALSLLESLTIREREIVVLHVISGLKHREIAKILNIPLGTVCWKYSESIKKLREICESKEDAV